MLSCWKTVVGSLRMNAMLKKCPCQNILGSGWVNESWLLSSILRDNFKLHLIIWKTFVVTSEVTIEAHFVCYPFLSTECHDKPLPCANQEALRRQGVNDQVPDDPQPRRFGDEQGDRRGNILQSKQKDANREIVCICHYWVCIYIYNMYIYILYII